MVSIRCKMTVKEELKKLGLHFVILDMGLVDIMEDLTDSQRDKLRTGLAKSGLELMDDKKALLIEKIKTVIVDMVYNNNELPKTNFSDFLSGKLNGDYATIAAMFSEAQGITIEKFIISLKVERIKELIIYDELNLTEIAWKLGYSSIAHLSAQFKKVTGLTPSEFKKMKVNRLGLIEQVKDQS